MPSLLTENGPKAGTKYKLDSPKVVVGRHPECDVVVEVGAVSRHHAQFLEIGGQYYVEDLNSRNGTFVNDEIVRGRHRLHEGDRIKVCDVSFRFGVIPSLMDDDVSSVIMDDRPHDQSQVMSRLDVVGGSVAIVTSPEAKLQALIDISRSLSRSLAIERVLPTLLESLFKLFVQADRGFIVLRNEEGELIPRHTKLRRDDDRMIRLSKTILKQVVDTKQAILSTDTMDDQRFELSESIADFRIRSFIIAPLIDAEGTVLGAIQLDSLDHRNRFKPEDLDLLASVAGQAGIAIDNAHLHDQVVRQRVLERDLEMASDVQQGFLPDVPPKMAGYSFNHYYHPADKVGGDYFTYVTLPDGRTAVVVADVVGHGMAAALQTAQLSAALQFSLATHPDPAAAISALNETLSGGNIDGRFVTLVMIVLYPDSPKVTIVNAGHMPPILCRAGLQPTDLGAELRDLPLLIDSFEYASVDVELQPGDRVVMYTDGLNEAMDVDENQFGKERMDAQLVGTQGGDELIERLVDSMRTFSGGIAQKDDMCVVCCSRE